MKNNVAEYRRIMTICKAMRENDILDWNSMEDRARRTTDKRGLSGLSKFLKETLDFALNWRYYHRCHLQGQKNYVEVTIEKDALAPLVEEACWPLCPRMSVTKGQPSATLMQQIAGRMEAALARGQNPMLIHFGDLDPTGVQVPLSMQATLERVHGLQVEVIMGGLTPTQCVEHDLPQSLDAVKDDDPNISRWYSRYGDQPPTELDARHPAKIKDLVREKVLGAYDSAAMREQAAIEAKEEEILKIMRRSTLEHLRSAFPSQMEGLEGLR